MTAGNESSAWEPISIKDRGNPRVNARDPSMVDLELTLSAEPDSDWIEAFQAIPSTRRRPEDVREFGAAHPTRSGHLDCSRFSP